AAVRDDGQPERRAIDSAASEKTRMRVDRSGGVEGTVLRQEVRQIEVGFVKSADCSDVSPVTGKNESADIPPLDRSRDDVLSEIDQIVLKALHQNVPTKYVNAHRRLIQFLLGARSDGSELLRAHFEFAQYTFVRRLLD